MSRPKPTSVFNAACGDIVLRMAANFPGLVDGDDKVNGGDLTEWLSNEIYDLSVCDGIVAALFVDRAKNGTPDDGVGVA